MDPKLSHSLTHFAAKFCNKLEKNKTSICSPISAEIVLALVALGCRNQTHAELLKALDLPDDDAIRSSFSQIMSTLEGFKGTALNMANKVYLQKDGNIKCEIKKDAEEVFKSSLEQLDFKESKAAADVINKWVAEQTNDLIKDIVSADMIEENTRILLVNAIYFKGTWEKAFRKYATWDRPFHMNNSTTTGVLQMYLPGEYFLYGVSPELQASLLRMNYQGGDTSMLIVLPNEIEGLDSVMQQLAAGYDLMADIAAMEMICIDITIPQFKAEMTIDLNNILPKLGIETIFDKNRADIDMLTSSEKLNVSRAVQKAFIEVDEAGTEAVATTPAQCVLRCALPPNPNPQFTADKPFLYLLVTQEIPVFIGIYDGSEYGSNNLVKSMKIMNRCGRHTFEADRPFLYLLTANQIPLFIGAYRGTAEFNFTLDDLPYLSYFLENGLFRLKGQKNVEFS